MPACTVEDEFSAQDIFAAQHELRRALGLEDQRFTFAEFMRSLGDEVDQLRVSGFDDVRIATLIGTAIARDISSDAIGDYSAPADGLSGP